jgi:hypothetical protein
MTQKLKAKIRWPDLNTSPHSWSNAELRGVVLNPVMTGIGRHPRMITDEDWVMNCEKDVEQNGLAQFLTDLLHILHVTVPKFLGEPPSISDYPQRKTEEEVPLPNVSAKGDRDWKEDEWTGQMVGGMLCNPVRTGI